MARTRLAVPLDRVRATGLTWCHPSADLCRLGECQHAVRAGLFSDADRPYSIGEVISGKAAGRRDGPQLALFDATGLALQDLAAAELAACIAEERQAGRTICLD
jgi:alanine dehydrogenase